MKPNGVRIFLLVCCRRDRVLFYPEGSRQTGFNRVCYENKQAYLQQRGCRMLRRVISCLTPKVSWIDESLNMRNIAGTMVHPNPTSSTSLSLKKKQPCCPLRCAGPMSARQGWRKRQRGSQTRHQPTTDKCETDIHAAGLQGGRSMVEGITTARLGGHRSKPTGAIQ